MTVFQKRRKKTTLLHNSIMAMVSFLWLLNVQTLTLFWAELGSLIDVELIIHGEDHHVLHVLVAKGYTRTLFWDTAICSLLDVVNILQGDDHHDVLHHSNGVLPLVVECADSRWHGQLQVDFVTHLHHGHGVLLALLVEHAVVTVLSPPCCWWCTCPPCYWWCICPPCCWWCTCPPCLSIIQELPNPAANPNGLTS